MDFSRRNGGERSVGVIIPAYDPDIQTLETYIGQIRTEIDPETVRVEIDAPRQIQVDRLEETADTVSVSHIRRGKGAAIMDGFDSLETDILLFTDADGSVPASSLDDILSQVCDGSASVSLASRRHPSSHIISHQTVVRRLLGDLFASVARRALPTQCRDYQCGAKAVTAEAWNAIGHHCYEPGFAWDLEFVSVAGSLGCEIVEVPITWSDHPDSTVNPVSTSIELATALIDVRRRTAAIATSPRHRDITVTNRSRLINRSGDDDD